MSLSQFIVLASALPLAMAVGSNGPEDAFLSPRNGLAGEHAPGLSSLMRRMRRQNRGLVAISALAVALAFSFLIFRCYVLLGSRFDKGENGNSRRLAQGREDRCAPGPRDALIQMEMTTPQQPPQQNKGWLKTLGAGIGGLVVGAALGAGIAVGVLKAPEHQLGRIIGKLPGMPGMGDLQNLGDQLGGALGALGDAATVTYPTIEAFPSALPTLDPQTLARKTEKLMHLLPRSLILSESLDDTEEYAFPTEKLNQELVDLYYSYEAKYKDGGEKAIKESQIKDTLKLAARDRIMEEIHLFAEKTKLEEQIVDERTKDVEEAYMKKIDLMVSEGLKMLREEIKMKDRRRRALVQELKHVTDTVAKTVEAIEQGLNLDDI